MMVVLSASSFSRTALPNLRSNNQIFLQPYGSIDRVEFYIVKRSVCLFGSLARFFLPCGFLVPPIFCAGVLEQSTGAWEPNRNRVVVHFRQAT
jgi:hypothetical protein